MMHRTDPRIAKAPPACPVCDSLVCVCRPRFFAGQLLTDVELTAQQEWAINKNRLHNLHLHGAGVVCGLKVSCHPSCAGWVRISEGYAISPCGDDIVVCEPDDFDLIGAIDDCLREQARHTAPDCSPRRGGTVDCTPDGEWCISIRYEEWADRPVRPLRKGHEGFSSPGCSCDGRSSGMKGAQQRGHGGRGCSSCGSGSPTTHAGGRGCIACGGGNGRGESGCGKRSACECQATPITSRAGPPECEPTRWCEGYRLYVHHQEIERERSLADVLEGTLLGQLIECWTAIAEMQSLVASYRTPRDSCYALEQIKAKLLVFVEQIGVTKCDLIDRIHAIGCDPPSPDIAVLDIDSTPSAATGHHEASNYIAGVRGKVVNLQQLSYRLLIFCLCENLLPPCPTPPTDEGLCLACVTVKGGRIVDICNFGCRHHVVTWPAVRWWASILPIEPMIQMLVEWLCCGDVRSDRLGAIANPAVAQMIKQWLATERASSVPSTIWGGFG